MFMDIKNFMSILKLTDLFNEFSTENLLDLFSLNNYKITQYKKGSIIHFESETCISWDIILNGEIIVQKIDEKGNVLTITEFGAGDTIGGNLLFSRHPYYPLSVFAKSDTIFLHIDKGFVLKLCHDSQDFLTKFLTCISDKTTILTNKIKSISLKTIRESIIDYINYEYYSQKNRKIKLHITKKELAERLGIQRTSLSRELNKMKKDGLIDYDAHHITIINFGIVRKV